MSKKIDCMFAPNEKVHEISMKKITERMLRTYCKLFGLVIDDYFLRSDRYSVPGMMILDFFRSTIAKLYDEDNDFPIKKADGIDISCGTTLENRIYTGDKLIFRAQKRFVEKKSHCIKALCRVEIYRNESIVFAGIFTFTQEYR
jgi:hypothetical protein